MPHANPEELREYKKQYYIKNREVIKARANARYIIDPEGIKKQVRTRRVKKIDEIREQQSEYRRNNREVLKQKEAIRKHSNKDVINHRQRAKKYGMTDEELTLFLETRNHRCEACGGDARGRNGHVDHAHETGRVRGLLCSGCNVALGQVEESIDRLNALIKYIGEHNARM